MKTISDLFVQLLYELLRGRGRLNEYEQVIQDVKVGRAARYIDGIYRRAISIQVPVNFSSPWIFAHKPCVNRIGISSPHVCETSVIIARMAEVADKFVCAAAVGVLEPLRNSERTSMSNSRSGFVACHAGACFAVNSPSAMTPENFSDFVIACLNCELKRGTRKHTYVRISVVIKQ